MHIATVQGPILAVQTFFNPFQFNTLILDASDGSFVRLTAEPRIRTYLGGQVTAIKKENLF
jgi:hypothetical protein